jgi:hypothetical protein
MGTMGVVLGLALAPGAAVGVPAASAVVAAISRLSGLVVCASLLGTGILLRIGAGGGLGERAPTWVADSAGLAWVALFVWIVFASVAARRPSAAGRAALWLAMGAGVSLLLMVVSFQPIATALQIGVVQLLVSYLLLVFIYTNESILLFLLFWLLIWMSPMALLAVFAVRLWNGRLETDANL